MPRFNFTLTITAGTPICLGGTTFGTLGATLQTTALQTAGKQGPSPIYADPISIEVQINGQGVVYVMDGISYLRVPAHTNSTDLSTTLASAQGSTSTPGGQYTDGGRLIDLNRLWIDGATTGDTVTISGNWRG